MDQINAKWKGTIILGVVAISPSTIHFPSSAILLRRPCWIATHDYVNVNGTKYQSKYAEILDEIRQDTVITMTLTYSGSLCIQVGQKNLEEFATGLPHHVYPVFDLYGKCEKISILHTEIRNGSPINEEMSMPPIFNGIHNSSVAGSTCIANNGGGTDGATSSGLETDRNVPHCEKADLEVHEKETDISLPTNSDTVAVAGTSAM